MATSKKAGRLHSPMGIACYAHVHQPRQRTDAKGNPKGEPKYSVLMFFDSKTDLSKMEAEIERKAVEKFGPKAVQMLANGKLHNPIRSASEFEENGAPFTNDLRGYCVSFKTSDKPGIVDEDGIPIMDKSEFYSGCEARVSYRVFAYDNESKGVGMALINLQRLGEGERLSGNPSAEEDFGVSKRKSRDDDDDTAVSRARAKKPVRRASQDDDDDDLLG